MDPIVSINAGGFARYRYQFNGMEVDDEVKGRGNSYDFGARMYDSRLGRWLTIDPLASKYPSLSAYSFVANCPIKLIDPNGKEIVNAEEPGSAAWKKVDAAIKVVKRTNPELYNELHNLPEKINVQIAKLNPEGTTSSSTGRIEYGLTEYGFSVEGNLKITNIIYDKNGNPLDAQVLGSMSTKEKQEMSDRLWEESGEDTDKYNSLLEGVSYSKVLTDQEASKQIGLAKDANNVIATITLDPLNVDKKSFSETLAHELGHAKFAIFNTVKAWIWKDGNLGKPNNGNGRGHDTNNPSGQAAEATEQEFKKNY